MCRRLPFPILWPMARGVARAECARVRLLSAAGPAFMQPWECDGVIECGKVVVRPGDAIIGDQDGVVCVPAAVAEKVYEIAHNREVIEGIIKAELIASASLT